MTRRVSKTVCDTVFEYAIIFCSLVQRSSAQALARISDLTRIHQSSLGYNTETALAIVSIYPLALP